MWLLHKFHCCVGICNSVDCLHSVGFMYMPKQMKSWPEKEGKNTYTELQIRGSTEDNSKIIFLISQQKHMS